MLFFSYLLLLCGVDCNDCLSTETVRWTLVWRVAQQRVPRSLANQSAQRRASRAVHSVASAIMLARQQISQHTHWAIKGDDSIQLQYIHIKSWYTNMASTHQ